MGYAPLGQGRMDDLYDDPRLTAIAGKYSKTARQVTLRHQLQCGVVVIPKSVHKERLQENIAVFDFSLTDEEMQVLRSMDKNQPLIGNPLSPELVEMSTSWG